MKKLISCKYHEDSQTVELRYTDGTLIDIDFTGMNRLLKYVRTVRDEYLL